MTDGPGSKVGWRGVLPHLVCIIRLITRTDQQKRQLQLQGQVQMKEVKGVEFLVRWRSISSLDVTSVHNQIDDKNRPASRQLQLQRQVQIEVEKMWSLPYVMVAENYQM